MLNPLSDFIAFDLETTGLERDADEIIEIGAVRVSNGEIVDRMSCLLKAEKPLSAMVESLTGISAAMLTESGIELKAGLELFLAFIGDRPLVAHNSDFDTTFMGHALAKVSLPPLTNKIYDSLLLARTAWPTMDSHRLETLVEKLEIPVQPAHRALPDAEQAALLWIKGQAKLATYSENTLSTLRHILETGPAAWRDLFLPSTSPFINPFSTTDLKTSGTLTAQYVNTANASASLETLMAQGNELDTAFSSLGRTYEARPRQIRLATLVERSFKENRFLAVDAEPGTGRMFASLIAGARASLAKKRPVYIVAHGRARIENTVTDELPILQALLGKGLRVSILKSPSAYLSPRKFASILAHPETRLRDDEKLAIMPLITWLENTVEGDINESMGFNHERNRLLWSKLACESYLGEAESHAYAIREQAVKAHLVFVSYDLFFEDLSLDCVLLPPYENIIFDEAHRLSEQGQDYLGREVSFFRLKDILQLLAYSKTEDTGLLAELERQTQLLSSEENLAYKAMALELVAKLKEKVFEPERQLQKFFNKIGKHAQKKRKDGESRIRYADKLILEFSAGPEGVFTSIEELSEILISLATRLPELAADLRKVTDKLRDFRIDLDHVSHPPVLADESENSIQSPREVFWIEDFPNPHRALIRSAPINVGHILAEKFLPQMEAIVMASPALTLGEEFGFFTPQVGLDQFPDKLKTALVRSQNSEPALDPIFIARFSPVLNNAAAAQTMSGIILRGLKDIVRPAFIYFTHIGMLKQIRSGLQEGLAESGRMVLAQHVDGSRESLLHLFRRRPNVCLLGTEAFTSNLGSHEAIPEIIIVTKLPFPVPTEPITAAHLDQIQAAKENPLYDYLLPSSILRLKQELNRMPRRAGQKQIIWILDPRPLTEKYGRLYVRGLGREVIVCESEEDLILQTKLALQIATPEINTSVAA